MSFPSAPGPNGECTGEPAATGPIEPSPSGPSDPGPLARDSTVLLEQTGELRLDQFLKWQGLVGTGGEAKFRIQQGNVRVNGELEQRRGRKLQPGDRVQLAGQEFVVPPFQARL